eukprot:4479504-Pyramimonas_sp.AAC.1
MWVNVEEEVFRAIERAQEGFLANGGYALVGGWKMLCGVNVPGQEEPTLYLNHYAVESDSLTAGVIAPILTTLLEEVRPVATTETRVTRAPNSPRR